MAVVVVVDGITSTGSAVFAYGLPSITSFTQNTAKITINGLNFGSVVSDITVTLVTETLTGCVLTLANARVECNLTPTSQSGGVTIKVKTQLSGAYVVSLKPTLTTVTAQSSLGGVISIQGSNLGISDVVGTNVTITVGGTQCQDATSTSAGIATCNVSALQASLSTIPQIIVYINGFQSYNQIAYKYTAPVFTVAQDGNTVVVSGVSLGLVSPQVVLVGLKLTCTYITLHSKVRCTLPTDAKNGDLYFAVNGFNVSSPTILTPVLKSISGTPTQGGYATINGYYFGSVVDGAVTTATVGSMDCTDVEPVQTVLVNGIRCVVASALPPNSGINVTVADLISTNPENVMFNYLAPVIHSITMLPTDNILTVAGDNFGLLSIGDDIELTATETVRQCMQEDGIESPVYCTIDPLTQLNGDVLLTRNFMSSVPFTLALVPAVQSATAVPYLGGQITLKGGYLNTKRYDGSDTDLTLSATFGGTGEPTLASNCIQLVNETSIECSLQGGAHGKSNLLQISIDGKTSIPIKFQGVPPIVKEATSVLYRKGGNVTIKGYNFVEPLSVNIGLETCFNITYIDSTQITCKFSGQARRTDPGIGLFTEVISDGLVGGANVFFYSDDIPCGGSPPCSGHGVCLSGGSCQCNSGYVGLICDQSSTSTNNGGRPTGDQSNADFSGFSVFFTHIRELDINDVPIVTYPVSDIVWKVVSNTTNQMISVGKLEYEPNFNISVTTTIFPDETVITFAGEELVMAKNSLKYQLDLAHWFFRTSVSRLQLLYELNTPPGDNCDENADSNGNQFGGDESDLRWVQITVNEQTLITKFSQRYIIDNDVILSNTALLQPNDEIFSDPYYVAKLNATNSTSLLVVGMYVPNFQRSAIIDPNFSVLVVSHPKSEAKKCKTSTVITWWAALITVVGAAIGSVLFSFTVVQVQKRRFKREDISMETITAEGYNQEKKNIVQDAVCICAGAEYLEKRCLPNISARDQCTNTYKETIETITEAAAAPTGAGQWTYLTLT
ncbi:EGF-like domain-containing protein [Cavenderia fasciculata]|uniref:EGF-like domain-containing protein n=1 Tax=Cavenderia fasciculata TaxID=261658 RepID=F4PLC9_CACFS|nr:EGF-like domain-containing protein [Cavenderia fasciculata]EGG23351.1 EGF-like domain-containing protein [Cavenderia fasciculata]|eukprot:XP_004361202.1 EGF-like domain-containing protein [Cavenderia fasciculata]